MSERNTVIFLPEAGQPVIDAIASHNDTGYEVQAGDMALKAKAGQPGALDRLVAGEYAAVIAGARYSSAEVIKAGLDVIGSEDGLISSFFAMESRTDPDTEAKLFLADCAVVPDPSSEVLTKIAEQTCANVEKLGIKPVVAFITASLAPTAENGDVVETAVQLFAAQNPERASVGRVNWDEAKDEQLYTTRTGIKFPDGEKPNVFVLPELNSGNIIYKVLQDADGTGWKSQEVRVNSYIMEKNGRQIVLSNCGDTPQPTSEQLVRLAEASYDGVADPVVAFLSFSTEGSSKHQRAATVQQAARQFSELHPELTTFGEIQWDSARNEHIYKLKTGKAYPEGKAPNVFIFPNRDSGETVHRILQEPDSEGLTAVGPMLQGFKNGILLIDLSRGVDEEAGIAVVKLTGQLAGLKPSVHVTK